MRWLHLDPEGTFFYRVLERFSSVDDHRLRQISAGTFFYSVLMLTEGVGLLFEKRWAEWLTVFVTASFIPFEIYEIYRHLSTSKVVVLLINIVIVGYLILRLREKKPA
ncbi:MAG: DUF2127 domain-containing protein [Verrucomicrobiota bacterium]|nr:DUF2127 domain-containing protein [Verrucomicrobiota bacterium]